MQALSQLAYSVAISFMALPALGWRSFFLTFFRFVLGATMLWAGVQKMQAQQEFERTLRYIFGVPRRISAYLVHVVPTAEALLGLFLIVFLWPRMAALMNAALLLLFSANLLRLRLAGMEKLECNCFGTDKEASPISILLLRNLTLMGAAAVIYVCSDAPEASHYSAGYLVLVAAIAISFLALVLVISRALSLLRNSVVLNSKKAEAS